MTEPSADPFHRPTNAEMLKIAMTAVGDPGPVEAVSNAQLLAGMKSGDDPVGRAGHHRASAADGRSARPRRGRLCRR